MVQQCTLTNANADMYLTFTIRVVSSDGSTVRGTLVASANSALEVSESLVTRTIGPVTMDPVTVLAGDRIVVEFGVQRAVTATVLRSTQMSLGDPVAPPDDWPFADGTSGAGVPWIELIINDPPDVPTGLTQTAATLTTVDVDWTAPAAGTTPTAYDYRVDGGTPVSVAATPTDVHITGLTAATTYNVEVRSVAASGTSAWVSVSASTLYPPNAPTGLTQTAATFTTVDVDWTAPATGSAPTSYEYRVDGGAPVDVGLVLTEHITGLTVETAYTVEVRSVNAGGTSGWVSVSASTSPLPDAPTDLAQTDATMTTVDVDWTAPVTGSAPTSYDYRVDGGAPVSLGNVLTVHITGLAVATSYDVEVRSVNAGGVSSWASVEATTSAPEPPDPPTGLTQIGATTSSVTVAWTPPVAGTTPESYEMRVDGGVPFDVGLVTSYTVTGLLPDTTYTVEVRTVGGL